MSNHAHIIAKYLLEIGAVQLRPLQPFTWASGWRSPIYCDNRRTLSHPVVREAIRAGFVDLAKARHPEAQVICGVATGGIAHGVLVADALGLPFNYVRPEPKKHGLGNQVEGEVWPDRPVLIIEDLVSTGGSSLKAVEALRSAGAPVAGMLSIFHYGFSVAEQRFANAEVPFAPLCTLDVLLQVARDIGHIQPDELKLVEAWRLNPETWGRV